MLNRERFFKFFFWSPLLVLLTLGCAKTGGNAPGLSSTLLPAPSLPSDGTSTFALAYGSSSQDRSFLADRIAGYQAPGPSVIFNQWRRFAGNQIYNNTSEITQTPSYCFSGFDSSNNWLPSTNPGNGQTIQPGTFNNCVNSNPFMAASWSYIASPDRIYNAANGSNFNGFLSALKFSKFSSQAVLSSADSDDDAIGLIIAAVIDDSNNVHTLTAMRSQGGQTPVQGWGVVYRMNNTVVRTIDPKSVGGTSGSGWGGRSSLIRVERDGDLITAYASSWNTAPASFDTNDASKITFSLADGALGLSIFQGEQYYGYGTISQLGATFSSFAFSAPNSEADPTYLFDLLNNSVYVKTTDAVGYVLVPGMQSYNTLGFPKRIKNTETQKEFMINSATSYTEL